MKAVILNSGVGKRLGNITKDKPKCMVKIGSKESILSNQLRILSKYDINDILITTGPFEEKLIKYCDDLQIPGKISYINNDLYKETNYIYSIYLARNELNEDIILMHGDLVFEDEVFRLLIESKHSKMIVDSTIELPKDDFKAVIKDKKIDKIGISYFDGAVSSQPLYFLKKEDLNVWIRQIVSFIENNNKRCYAEDAFNEISNLCNIYPLDIKGLLCCEVDTEDDLKKVRSLKMFE